MESKEDILNPCYQVRRSCQRVHEKNSSPVTIHDYKIDEFIKELEVKQQTEGFIYEKWSNYHIDPNNYTLEQIVSYVFIVDALNFCFWPGNFHFEYENLTFNLAKLLKTDFFKPENLMKVDSAFIKKEIFSDLDFSLIEERARLVREVGHVIHSNYSDSFLSFTGDKVIDAPKLVRKLTNEICGFRDEAIFEGEQVFFYKRAQILVADLYAALSERTTQEIEIINLDQLTMFADYRVPQTLRDRGIFEYNKTLSDIVDFEIQMEYSSKEEVWIRAATVVAVEKIMDKIRDNEILKTAIKYSVEIDWLLWQIGEKNILTLRPHHRVLSIFY